METYEPDELTPKLLSYFERRNYLSAVPQSFKDDEAETARIVEKATVLPCAASAESVVVDLAVAEQQFFKFVTWISDLGEDASAGELKNCLLPLLCHMYLNSLPVHPRPACVEFLKNGSKNLISEQWVVFMEQLLTVDNPQDLSAQPLVKNYREVRLELRLLPKAVFLLRKFLSSNDLHIIIQVLRQWFRTTVLTDDLLNCEEDPKDFDHDKPPSLEVFRSCEMKKDVSDDQAMSVLLQEINEKRSQSTPPPPLLMYTVNRTDGVGNSNIGGNRERWQRIDTSKAAKPVVGIPASGLPRDASLRVKSRLMPVVCVQCGRQFRDSYNLKKHANTHVREWYTCFHCGKKACGKDSIRRHIILFHLSGVPRVVYMKRCSLCSFECGSVKEIELHLSQDHQLDLKVEYRSFDSKDDFLVWKEQLESETSSAYVKRRSDTGKQVTVSNFYCHRSGNPRIRPLSSRQRSMKVLGSNKIGGFCPAYIHAKFSPDGKVHTRGIYQHVGHDFRLERLRLKTSFRKKIAEEFLSKRISFRETIELNRNDSPEKGALSRESLLSPKDLHNISRDYNIERDVKSHSDDSISVRMWVEDNPNLIRYQKFQGQIDTNHPELKETDFILIIMNDPQMELLKRFGTKVICIDGTRGTNGYQCDLTTIMVLDDNNDGVPGAFLFSNRADGEIMTFFLEKVSEFTGTISCEVFMSDVAEIYFGAWTSTMGSPAHRLFCPWHVKRAWAKHKPLISGDKSMKESIFQKLTTILVEPDERTFLVVFESFLAELLQNEQTAEFGKYLQTYYASNVECWAYCYRKNCGVYTNTHLERMHVVLKHKYMNGKKIKRLDRAIHDVISMLDDKVSHHRGYDSKRLGDLKKRHTNAESNSMTILPWTEQEWIVSLPDLSDVFTVQQIRTYCDEERCGLLCEPCEACFHMFVCSCHDSAVLSRMCEHIHAVCLELKSSALSLIIEPASDIFFETTATTEPIDEFVTTHEESHSCLSHENIIAEMTRVMLMAKTNEHFQAIYEAAMSLENIINSSTEDIETVTSSGNITLTPQRETFYTIPKLFKRNDATSPRTSGTRQ